MRLQVIVPQMLQHLPRQCQDIPRNSTDFLERLASESQRENLSGACLKIRLQRLILLLLWARKRHHWWMHIKSQPQWEVRRHHPHQDLRFQPMSTLIWNNRVHLSADAWVLIPTQFWIKLMTTVKHFPRMMKKGCDEVVFCLSKCRLCMLKAIFLHSNIVFYKCLLLLLYVPLWTLWWNKALFYQNFSPTCLFTYSTLSKILLNSTKHHKALWLKESYQRRIYHGDFFQ